MNEQDLPRIIRALKTEFDRHRMPIVDLIQQQEHDPFKVLVATILSARTKDQTTAAACSRLFQKVTSPADLQVLSESQIRDLIYPVGFFHNKARFLHQLPGALASRFSGRIPDTVDELVVLPGVGRKTANLVVAVGFGKPAICVDVHVHRITNRWGYVRTHTPFETEMALREKLPRRYWLIINSIVVSFGQHLCLPRNPRCSECPIARYCDRTGLDTVNRLKPELM